MRSVFSWVKWQNIKYSLLQGNVMKTLRESWAFYHFNYPPYKCRNHQLCNNYSYRLKDQTLMKRWVEIRKSDSQVQPGTFTQLTSNITECTTQVMRGAFCPKQSKFSLIFHNIYRKKKKKTEWIPTTGIKKVLKIS